LRNLLKSDGLLLSAAIIWGFAFVAQRVGMVYIGPFLFNGVRFALGCLVLLPLVLKNRWRPIDPATKSVSSGIKTTISAGVLAGLALFSGASFQQVGLVNTTAGNAGFITGLYVVIVPLLALFWGTQTGLGTWIGASLAAVGLYLLSVTGHLAISFGDLLEIIGAFFWAGHVLIIGRFSSKIDPLQLALFQYAICAILSLITAFFFETFYTLQSLSGRGSDFIWRRPLSRCGLYLTNNRAAACPSSPCSGPFKSGSGLCGRRRSNRFGGNPGGQGSIRVRIDAVGNALFSALGIVIEEPFKSE